MNAIQTMFSLLYVIRKHRLFKNGETSIYLRITLNREVADITTKRVSVLRCGGNDANAVSENDIGTKS